MFTGLIEEMGVVTEISSEDGPLLKLAINSDLDNIAIGDSIAVNGCCLTAVKIDKNTFFVEAVAETLSRTNLSDLKINDRVNLERALKVGDRLGGHFVQGHVDGVGEILRTPPLLSVKIPQTLKPFVAIKGSIALDGISLTVADVTDEEVSIAIIPHTLSNTTLADLRAGSSVNIEVDIIARYTENLIRKQYI